MTSKIIFEGRTENGPIWIHQQQEILQLKFDPLAIQSEINIRQPQQLRMLNLQYLMGILLFMPQPQKILMLGVGGGSLIHFIHHHLPQAHITGIEYDAELLDIAQQHLLLPQPDKRLSYVIEDARQYIKNCQQRYDLIIVDIFDGSQTPDWILESEFTHRLKQTLSDQGALSYNLLMNSEKEFKRYYKSIREIFSRQAVCMETDDYENILVYALNFSGQSKSMEENLLLSLEMLEKYQLPFSQILSSIYSINPIDSGII